MVYFNECVKFKVNIEGCFKYCRVIWIKDDQNIDFIDIKYKGSICDDKFVFLCINDVKENDEVIYIIEVSNELEKVKSSQKLVVIKSKV